MPIIKELRAFYLPDSAKLGGEKGAKLREISRLAREDISKMLGKNVYLEVWVRVRKGWGDDAQVLKSLGY